MFLYSNLFGILNEPFIDLSNGLKSSRLDFSKSFIPDAEWFLFFAMILDRAKIVDLFKLEVRD